MGSRPSRPVDPPASQPSNNTTATSQTPQKTPWRQGIESYSFKINTVPGIQKDSIIIGLCGAAFPHTEQDMRRNGWLLADFYGWNNLMKIIGDAQDWITAVDPTTLLNVHGNLLLGDPRGVRKVVLSHNLLRGGDITTPIVTEPDKLLSRFLECVEVRAKQAREKKVPLVIFMSCHGVFRYMMAVGEKPTMEHGQGIGRREVDKSMWLKPEALLEKIGDGIDAMIICPDSFGGSGWHVYPSEYSVHNTNAAERSKD
jgi:hypothetical protein